MARLSTEKIKEELATKNFTLVDDTNYSFVPFLIFRLINFQ